MFKLGQRWFSKTEPELGLAFVLEDNERLVTMSFPAANEERIYNKKTAPLQRVVLKVGERAETADGESFLIEKVEEKDGIFFYHGEGKSVAESLLNSQMSLIKPEERAFIGDFDHNDLFDFRYESLLLTRSLQQYEARGLEGSRINIIGHQVSIFEDVLQKMRPKLVLADEVGLGKTIEAGLLAKNLFERKLARSILVLAPMTLQYQWFVELYKKFNFIFKTMGAGDEVELTAQVENDDLIITSMNHLLEDEAAQKLVDEKDWDLIIVDEAHRFKESTPAFEQLRGLTSAAKNVFYLTATPEALGEKNFFELLKLLAPQKYKSFEDFKQSEAEYQKTDPSDKEALKRYNYERDYFRNRRKNLEKERDLFPQKRLNPFPLPIEKPTDKKVIDAKVETLSALLRENPAKKFLAIGKSRKLAIETQRLLAQKLSVKTALFHGEQSLLERDRQAAYFADPEGAQVLVSAESGSEGRNFEFASELFLLDLPTHPQALLQRIGRLDRIGQKNLITIHLPFVLNSMEENLFKLHHEAFRLFESFPTGIVAFWEEHKSEIEQAMGANKEAEINKLARRYEAFQTEAETAKNAFLDAHSYKEENVAKVLKKVNEFHQRVDLQSYLEKAFNFAGVENQELSSDIYFAKPSDNMLIPSYPNLPSDGASYTTSRAKAMERQDVSFMNFEHPLFQGSLDLFSGGSLGNATAATLQGKLGEAFFIELIFRVEAKLLRHNDVARFFPLTPLRVLLKGTGADATSEFPKKRLDALLAPLEENERQNLASALPKENVLALIEKARKIAAQRAQRYNEEAKKKVVKVYQSQIEQIRKWSGGNPFAEAEITKLLESQDQLLSTLEKMKVDLDSLRIIV